MIETEPLLRRLPRPLTIVLLVGWTLLVWELLTGTRLTTRPWTPWMPYVYNAGHAVLFGVHALLLGLALRPGRGPVGRPRAAWLTAALAAFLYGALLEWRQGAIPGRQASVFDLATNAVGAFGVPWALAAGSLLNGRTVVVVLAALACAVLARTL